MAERARAELLEDSSDRLSPGRLSTIPLVSAAGAPFWRAVRTAKLRRWALDASPRGVRARWTSRAAAPGPTLTLVGLVDDGASAVDDAARVVVDDEASAVDDADDDARGVLVLYDSRAALLAAAAGAPGARAAALERALSSRAGAAAASAAAARGAPGPFVLLGWCDVKSGGAAAWRACAPLRLARAPPGAPGAGDASGPRLAAPAAWWPPAAAAAAARALAAAGLARAPGAWVWPPAPAASARAPPAGGDGGGAGGAGAVAASVAVAASAAPGGGRVWAVAPLSQSPVPPGAALLLVDAARASSAAPPAAEVGAGARALLAETVARHALSSATVLVLRRGPTAEPPPAGRPPAAPSPSTASAPPAPTEGDRAYARAVRRAGGPGGAGAWARAVARRAAGGASGAGASAPLTPTSPASPAAAIADAAANADAGERDAGGSLVLRLTFAPAPALGAVAGWEAAVSSGWLEPTEDADADDAEEGADAGDADADGDPGASSGGAAARALAGAAAAASRRRASAARAAVRVHLSLARWRAAPALRAAGLSHLRVLLVGAGTLGCHVARLLLAWAVTRVTLLDGGRVGVTAPARQPLYEYADAEAGAPKAAAAAAALRRVHPGARVRAVELEVPSPGVAHAGGAAGAAAAGARVERLSRRRVEPTLAITVALSFAGFLVMRHGRGSGVAAPAPAPRLELHSSGGMPPPALPRRLACYFCGGGAAAPADSRAGGALDATCSSTRPGAAPAAAAAAVELLAALAHHPAGLHGAPPDDDDGGGGGGGAAGASPLGATPHAIRGSLARVRLTTATTPAEEGCCACGAGVRAALRSRGAGALAAAVAAPGGSALLDALAREGLCGEGAAASGDAAAAAGALLEWPAGASGGS